MNAQRFVLRHWRWAINHASIHGHGLVGHHNWLKWCLTEDQAEVTDGCLPGVLVDGRPTRRSDWA